MHRVYVLHVAEEAEDELSMSIHSIYTTREKAEAIGKNLVLNNTEGAIFYYISEHMIFQ